MKHSPALVETREIRVGHMCCSIGAGAKGFNEGSARVGNLKAKFRCIGGIDVVASALRDFERLTGCPGTLLDLFTLEQYIAFHGEQPPADWREATPADIHRAFGHERPHVVFMSPPCKGYSGLLSQSRSETAKYQALNQLALRSVWLVLEAYKDDPPEFLLFENVPRIESRGRALLDQIEQLLGTYGYASAETTHDCGELGGLAQSRKRFLLVARHAEKVPPFLFEPPKRPLRAVGDVLGKMRLPGDPAAGPMHRIPQLHWRTWVRLAFVEAGKDWRSLQRLAVQNGILRDYAIAGEYRNGSYGVHDWNHHAGTVCSRSGPSNGNFAVADPRINGHHKSVQMGVRRWTEPAAAVTASSWAGTGPNSVADPRIASVKHNNCFRVVRWSDISPSVTGGTGPTAGGLAVADPRPRIDPSQREKYRTAGHYGVVRWDETAGTVTAASQHDNGRGSVADPRLPQPGDRLAAMIRSEDGTWHRPFTTLELAALQSLFDPEEDGFILEGSSDGAWREHIGNAVPPDAAKAIADVIGHTLLLAWSGETFALGSTPIWVRPFAIALSVMQRKTA